MCVLKNCQTCSLALFPGPIFPGLVPSPHSQASFPVPIPRPHSQALCIRCLLYKICAEFMQGLGTRLSISILVCRICVQVHCLTCPDLFSPWNVWNAVCAIFVNCQQIPTLGTTHYLAPDISGANLSPWQPQ